MSSVDAPAEGAPAEEAAAPVDELRAELLASFTEALGDGVVDSHVRVGDDLWLRIAPAAWAEAAQVARQRLGFRYFNYLSAIDWRPSPFGRYEDAEVDTPLADKIGLPYELVQGYAGGETRFQVIARVTDIERHHSVHLKVDVADDDLAVDTWTGTYAGADWHERETWEMFGISFRGHPDPRHIYLPSEFEGFPLRKDFPLLARVVKPWPGIVDVEGMPGAAASEGDADAEGGTSE